MTIPLLFPTTKKKVCPTISDCSSASQCNIEIFHIVLFIYYIDIRHEAFPTPAFTIVGPFLIKVMPLNSFVPHLPMDCLPSPYTFILHSSILKQAMHHIRHRTPLGLKEKNCISKSLIKSLPRPLT